MVHRKAPGKLGVLASGGLKTDCSSANMKPSLQNHDSKNKGTDLRKKKMKKSRSLKQADYESFKPLNRRHEAPKQPGKLPPCGGALASPQKKSPNYMKSTSSSKAKKVQAPVSTRNIPIGYISSNGPSPTISNNSKSKLHSLSHKLSKTSGLKRVRTLIKEPSFKLVRTSVANKCSREVILCLKLEVQRATCSSTLKDSKLPPYLMLNSGDSESEGTSIMKVCPYTYCSLNSHHHSSAPPLKSFLNARRRLLKTQSIRRLEFLSPTRAKPSDHDKIREVDSELVVNDDVLVTPEMDMISSNDKASSELLQSKSNTDEEGIEEIEAAKTGGSNYAQELLDTQGTSKRTMRCKRLVKDSEEVRKFNPREPNYLPVEPEIEGERVDLRHQEIDKRKNAEEWMLDYALQRAVSKLAPARKSKVALLVAAFETVMPIPKCETHLRQNTAGFAHARPMQACS